MGSQHQAAKDRRFNSGKLEQSLKMFKWRHPSGDCGSESSGYYSSSETQVAGTEDILTRPEALHLLSLAGDHPLITCDNRGRGCPVKSYPRLVGIHSLDCQFQEVRKLSVRSRLNILGADARKFRSFCSSFEATRRCCSCTSGPRRGTASRSVLRITVTRRSHTPSPCMTSLTATYTRSPPRQGSPSTPSLPRCLLNLGTL